jgi:fatty-acyl-CoA synthase
MQGLMMHRPLRIADILSFAEDSHAAAGIVSSTVEGGIHRTTYGQIGPRIRQLADALGRLGVKPGDRIATLAWNGYRHYELYFAVSGIGAICHTINPRLSADQMRYIVNHAGDTVLFLDLSFVDLVEGMIDQFPPDLRYVIMADRAHMPDTSLPGVICYEDLLASGSTDLIWPEFDENTASSLCDTSGTPGTPQGVLDSHRSTVLHALMCGVAFPNGIKAGRRLMPVVPLFHANAWGLPYVATLTGASIVFPGPHLDGKSVYDLMDGEQVNSAWGVPTVWLGLLAEAKARGRLPNGFDEVVVGGSAAPRSMIETFEDQGVSVCHAWGMTEMSPIGTQGMLTPPYSDLPRDQQIDLKSKQGRRTFGVELKIVDEAGQTLPHDGKATGELFVRGNTILSGYFENPEASADAFDVEGWFGTGDVASISPDGFLTITDRAKDLIKSGGEWISSIDVENLAMSHPSISNCAVIAVPHPKWDERPVLIVVPQAGQTPDTDDILAHLSQHLAKWQLPDKVVFVEALPLTATGKVSKMTLRQSYADLELTDDT